MPLYGGLPVKLRTVVGPPVEYDPDNCSPEQLRDLCRDAIKGEEGCCTIYVMYIGNANLQTCPLFAGLINEHQRRPGSVLRALRERLRLNCRRSRSSECSDDHSGEQEDGVGEQQHLHAE